jgi:hypothetical protein
MLVSVSYRNDLDASLFKNLKREQSRPLNGFEFDKGNFSDLMNSQPLLSPRKVLIHI